jgi:RND superfamily putative drug exporter
LVLLNWGLRRLLNPLLRRLIGKQLPSFIVGPLDRAVFTPYEIRRTRLEHAADATHGFWAKLGKRIALAPGRVIVRSVAVLLILCCGFAFFSTELTSEDTYRSEVESVEGQDLLNKSFPAGTTALTDVVAPAESEGIVRVALEEVKGVEAVTATVAEGPPGVLIQATLEPNPYSTEAFDLIEPIRDEVHHFEPKALVGGPTAIEFDVRDAAGWDSTVIPPIILLVVFLILVGLLRAVAAPLVLIGTVILSYLAALGFGYFVIDLIFGFPGSDPSLPLFAFVFLVALGVDYNIFLIARAREETLKHGSKEGILRALAVTGSVITSAGIVLAGTFSVLAILPLTFLTELGFVVAFGVLLDTFLVRSVLVPAIALRMGDKFWWPSSLSRPTDDREASLARTQGGQQGERTPSA